MVSKFIISGKRLRKRIGPLIAFFLEEFGVLMMLAEAADEVFGYKGLFECYERHWIWVFLILLLVSISKNWDWLSFTVKITNSPDVAITLKVCDALKNDGAVVIPTNTTFDTTMEDEFISKASIQGQYQIKYFKGRISYLDSIIDEGLKNKKAVQIKDGRKTKKSIYPIGTVCRINENNKRAYYIADSDINQKGIPVNVTAEDISTALTSLWNALQQEGNNETYSIPLLGTGKGRVRNASRNEIVQQIIMSFLAATKEQKITENLIICIHPNDFGKIDWDELCEFLKYQCLYSNIKPIDKDPVGVAESLPESIGFKENSSVNCVDEEKLDSSINRKFRKEEQKIVALLTGNKMSCREIAESTGLAVRVTSIMLNSLVQSGIVEMEGTREKRRYYVQQQESVNNKGEMERV